MYLKGNAPHKSLRSWRKTIIILYVTIPNNCTDRLQLLDLSVNKPAKDFVRARFQDWCGEEICKQLERKVNEDVDTGMKCMKPLCCSVDDRFLWLFGATSKHDHRCHKL